MIFDRIVSFAPSITRTRLTEGTLDIAMFERPVVYEGGDPSDKDGNNFTAARFTNNKRHHDNFIERTLITIDIDKDIDVGKIQDIKDKLQRANVEYIIHTTTSSTPSNPRYRLLIDISRPMTDVEYGVFTKYLCEAKFRIEADPASFVASQPMFLPLVLPERVSEYEYEYFQGEALDITAKLMEVPTERFTSAESSNEDTDAVLPIPKGLTEVTWLAAICVAYPAEGLSYDDWKDMGKALWHQTNGRGYQLWVDWSSKSSTHDEKHMPKKWRSFDPTGKRQRGITMRSILNKNNNRVLSKAYTYSLLQVVETPAQLDSLCEHISEDRFVKPACRMQVAVAVKNSYLKHTGENMSKDDAIKKIEIILSKDDLAWSKEWYLNAEDEKLHNEVTGEVITRMFFDGKYTHKMPLTASGTRNKAFDCMMKHMYGYQLQTINGVKYRPGSESKIHEKGMVYLNSFKNWPVVNRPFSDSEIDTKIAEYIDRHFTLLAGERADVKTYLQQHLAYLRQNPAKRIRVGLSITSTLTGVGKSMLKKVYECALGQSNTSVANGTDLTEKFNGFAARDCMVTFFEELNFQGNDKFNAMERIKEVITEDRLAIRKMFRDGEAIDEITSCFVFFSNYSDILGDQGSGRRWSVVDVPYYNHDDTSEVLGQPIKEFYAEYAHLMNSYPVRFAAYFDQVDTTGFNPNVPMDSSEKEEYRSNEYKNVVARAINEIIAENAHPLITKNYIVLSALMNVVKHRSAIDSGASNPDLIPLQSGSMAYKKRLLVEAFGAMGMRKAGRYDRKISFYSDGERQRINGNQVYFHESYSLEDHLNQNELYRNI